MRLLVLGGTRFLGRAVVDEAVSRGYDVTTFSRGLSGRPGPGAEAIEGDRTNPDDLRQLAGREWDGVIDTSAIAPVHVAASARLLTGQVGHYTYVSTLSVYRDFPREPVTEDSPVLECAAETSGSAESLGYPGLKAGSERAVAAALPGRSLLARPGLILGPREDVGYLTWWLARLARGGEVLAPGSPSRPVRFTDARDLAAWLVTSTRRGIPGVINVPGPEGMTFGQLLGQCAAVTAPARSAPLDLCWVSDAELLAAGAEPWSELPMWAPDTTGLRGIWRASGDRAERTGISYRPLADTVAGTWRWLRDDAAQHGRPVAAPAGRPGLGMDPAKEKRILAGRRRRAPGGAAAAGR